MIAGEKEEPETRAMLGLLRRRFIPNKVVLLHPSGKEGKMIESLVPFVASQGPVDGKTAAYICENYVCALPTQDLKEFEALLEK